MPADRRFRTHLTLTHTSLTRPRERVYDYFYQSGPRSRNQLFVALQGKIGLATIYRTVQRFVDIGIIEEIRPGFFDLSDRFKQHHHYFVCRICDHRVAFNDKTIEKSLQNIASNRHLILEDHLLELIGLCNKCSLRPAVKPKPAIGTRIRRSPGLGSSRPIT